MAGGGRGPALPAQAMRNDWICGLLLTGATLWGGGQAATGFTAPPLTVGEPFPNLLFPAAADHRPVSVHQFHGRKTLVHLFASW